MIFRPWGDGHANSSRSAIPGTGSPTPTSNCSRASSVRILEVVVRYPPFVGGVEASVHEVARRLAARGHDVRVICADDPPGSPSEVDGVQVMRLPWRFKAANTNLCFGLGEAIRGEWPDVIHTHLPTAFFAGRAASFARETGIPLVLTYHNDVAGEGLKGI